MKQMPMQHGSNKPTVAIITVKYYEKMAVDAMMTDKTTFVKYKTEGQWSVMLSKQFYCHQSISGHC